MYAFDGEYRRRPVQNLGGASQTSDRETLIRRAKEERAKRDELRRKNNGAIVLQSYARSFVARQRRKREERELYDEIMRTQRDKLLEDDVLALSLKKITFFYNSKDVKDCERLIELCQYIIRNPARLLRNSSLDFNWMHRLRRLLDLCITQLNVPAQSQAIPLRMLETFTAPSSVECYIENESSAQAYLQNIFSYLIKNEYYVRLRRLLELKCPPLDGETLHAPNPITDAIYQLVLRPLIVMRRAEANHWQNIPEITTKIYYSFLREILAAPYTEPIRFFLLPCLAQQADLPFELVLRTLQIALDEQNLEQRETAQLSNDNVVTFTGASAQDLERDFILSAKKQKKHINFFTPFLLNAILCLDHKYLDLLKNKPLLVAYVSFIAKISPKFLQLPRSLLKASPRNHPKRSQDEDSSDDEDYDDEINDNVKSTTDEKANDDGMTLAPLTSQEKEVLSESIVLLNDMKRVQAIAAHSEYLKDADILSAICEICHNLMIYNRAAIFEYKLLYTLAFSPTFMRSVWFTLTAQSSQMGFSAPLALISKGVVPKNDNHAIQNTIPLLATFCTLFARLLPTLHDSEFCDSKLIIEKPLPQTSHIRQMPFSIEEIIHLTTTLKEISLGLVNLAFPETRSNLNQHYRCVLGRSESDDAKLKQQKQIWANLLKVVVFVLNQIYTRDLRLGFCPESHWTVNSLDLPLDRPNDLPLTRNSRTRGIRPFQPLRDFTREDLEDGPPMSTKQIRSITILREIPFVVAFSKRVSILQGFIAADKMRTQGNYQAFLQGPSMLLTVRRTHLYEDAYDKLRPENEPDLRVKFRVQFVSALGLDEAGIDGGGVFREFLSELIKTAFDPNRGFFMVTTDNKLYPNPNVSDLVPDDYERHYYFIGRILGKAIYENLLVELPLAEFFLTKLAGKYADVDIHQLASLDPELYKNLLYLKDYEGDVSELGLDFTVATSSFGQTQVVELKPNGHNISVTEANRIEYVQLMADYKLNVQIKRHCTAFRRGLSNVLPVEWLYMFSNKELQILISGAEIPIDLEDLKQHCQYGGDYGPEHPAIQTFWSVLENFNDLQRRQLLKFVTSCSRPPLLGFKDLDPPFFIQNAGDMERLPTASTCTNLLKLPPFTNKEQMREKLLYAIQSGVGFELS